MHSIVRTVLLVLGAAIASPAVALTRGQTDSFAGSTEAWFVGGGPGGGGHPTPPVRIPGGGPAGAGDSYLQIGSTGFAGPGSRLAASNITQWAGDYVAAGVQAIELDLSNLGTTDLTIRLLFEDLSGSAPFNVAASRAVFLPAGSGWTHVRFGTTLADLEAVHGDAAAALTGADVVRMFHSTQEAPADLFPGEPISALLGVDNITAVPEPASVILMVLGLALVGIRRWRAGT